MVAAAGRWGRHLTIGWSEAAGCHCTGVAQGPGAAAAGRGHQVAPILLPMVFTHWPSLTGGKSVSWGH